MTTKENLSNDDHWFDCSLRAILGSEVELVKRGKKTRIDRKMLSDWIIKNTQPKTEKS